MEEPRGYWFFGHGDHCPHLCPSQSSVCTLWYRFYFSIAKNVFQVRWRRKSKTSKNMAFLKTKNQCLGLSSWLSGKEPTCQCRRHRFHPWSRKIPYAEKQPSPCITTEPLFCSIAQELQLLMPFRPGAHAPQEKPPQWEACTAQLESSPQSLQTREKAVQQQRLKKKKKNECLKTVIIQLFIIQQNSCSKWTASVLWEIKAVLVCFSFPFGWARLVFPQANVYSLFNSIT